MMIYHKTQRAVVVGRASANLRIDGNTDSSE